MANVSYPAAVLDMREAVSATRMVGFEAVTSEIQQAEDIAPGLEALRGRADALYVCGDPLVVANRIRINILALGARLPAMYSSREYVEGGGLMSYGPNTADLFRRAAEYVDKILRGAKPGDLPVEQPTKFELTIHLTTAKVLGLTVPPSLLGGQVQVIFSPLPESIEHIKAGKLRPLAVTTTTRLDVLPNVPTVGDFLPGYEGTGWLGVGAPKSTPAEIIDRLNGEISTGLTDPKIITRIAELGGTVLGGSPAAFGKINFGRRRKVGQGGEVRGPQAGVKAGSSANIP
jgi:Tripartite tricarboxylate transporter family receptor/ABC transporter substrate binding protein